MRRYLLLAIIALAAFLRLYKLDSYPVSISWDEAAIGYNAYSIAQTGKDEYGKKIPLLFQSFNDYKLPGYIYLDALTIKLFGFSDLTVRFPSALMGTAAVFLMYLLVRKLFDETTSKFDPSLITHHSSLKNVALLATFFLAISPWHLQFSRAAFESNVSLTIILAGVVLLLFGLKNKIAAAAAIPIMVLSLYFYYSPRIFMPLILVSFFALYRKEVQKNLKIFAVGLLVAAVISLPIISKTISTEGQKRIREVSVFAEPSFAQIYSQTRLAQNLPLESIFLNQRIPFALEILKNYASHFSPKFLFFPDDPNPRHRTPYHGNFYLFEVVTILLGFWILFRAKNSGIHAGDETNLGARKREPRPQGRGNLFKLKDQKSSKLLLVWLFAAPISAALARDAPHSLRALLMLVPLVVISATGANEILKKRPVTILVLVAALFFINYLIGYYFLYPQKDSISWAYGHKELYSRLKMLEASADSITVTGHYWKPYIFYLYYNKVDPSYYQREGTQEKIGKYNFGTTYWDSGGRDLEEADIEKTKGDKTIVALSPQEYEMTKSKSRFKSISQVYDYSGRTMLFKIGEWE